MRVGVYHIKTHPHLLKVFFQLTLEEAEFLGGAGTKLKLTNTEEEGIYKVYRDDENGLITLRTISSRTVAFATTVLYGIDDWSPTGSTKIPCKMVEPGTILIYPREILIYPKEFAPIESAHKEIERLRNEVEELRVQLDNTRKCLSLLFSAIRGWV